MRKPVTLTLLAGIVIFTIPVIAETDAVSASASAPQVVTVGNVQLFATLPQIINSTNQLAEGHPEGLCADSQGNIYANSFEQPVSNTYVQNYIYKFSPNGTLLTTTPVPSSPGGTKTGVVPLGCFSSGNYLYINDVYNGDEYQYTLPLSNTSLPTAVWHICGGFTSQAGPTCGLNANYVGPDGRVYMSDNGAALYGDTVGRIWVLDPKTGTSSIFLDSSTMPGASLLSVADLPTSSYVPNGSVLPYGPNGIAFSRDGSALYIANMSTNVILKQALTNCSSSSGCQPDGDVVQFSNDPLHFIAGPDNIDFDDNGNLWIASGQENHVVALNREGNVVGVFGGFQGLNSAGAPQGLLQPSGVIFSQGNIYIGNESNQSLVPTSANIDWPALKQFTISVVNANALQNSPLPGLRRR